MVFAMMGKFTETRPLNLTIFPEGRDIRDIIGHVHRVVLQFSHKKGVCLRTSGATGPLSRQTPTDDPLWQLVALAAGTGGHVDPVRLKHPVKCCRCGNLSFFKACEIRGTTDFSYWSVVVIPWQLLENLGPGSFSRSLVFADNYVRNVYVYLIIGLEHFFIFTYIENNHPN